MMWRRRQPDAVITLREVYDAVVRLTGSVDVLISQQNNTDKDVADHEGRIRGLEKSRWPLPAVAIVLSAIGFAYQIFN